MRILENFDGQAGNSEAHKNHGKAIRSVATVSVVCMGPSHFGHLYIYRRIQ